MSLKCILDEYFYFELSHWFPYLLFLDLALQILANLSLGVLIKFVLIKKKSVIYQEPKKTPGGHHVEI